MQCRVTLSKCRSNFTGKLRAFLSHSAAPAGEKFRTVQSTESPLGREILPTIKISCLGMSLRSARPYGEVSLNGPHGGSQSRGSGGDGSTKIILKMKSPDEKPGLVQYASVNMRNTSATDSCESTEGSALGIA
jgi:hypothetical protein